MGWNSNLPPLVYLERRLRYFKRRQTWLENLIDKEVVSKPEKNIWYIKDVIRKSYRGAGRTKLSQVRAAIKFNKQRVKEFAEAVEKLKQ